MDTSELIGAELDAAVARAQGWKIVNFSEGRDGVYSVPDDPHSFVGYLQLECPPPWFRPSTDWSQGGPIIERERIDIEYDYPDDPTAEDAWLAYAKYKGKIRGGMWFGPTPLIAAMRAFVASKK